MKREIHFGNYLAEIIFAHRWVLLFLLGCSALAFELLEHAHEDNFVDAHFIREIIFFAVLYPLAFGWLLDFMLNIQAERNQLQWQQELVQRLNRYLSQAKDSDNLYQIIASFPETVAPILGVCVFILLREDEARLNLAASRWAVSTRQLMVPAEITRDYCGFSAHAPGYGLHPLAAQKQMMSMALGGYCLPLFHGESLTGVLHLYGPQSMPLTAVEVDNLNAVAAMIAWALYSKSPQNAAAVQAATKLEERRHIARHLHDTLAQNLAYLQVKLDVLAETNLEASISTIQQELDRMGAIASQAYEQVRQIMHELQSPASNELAQELVEMARTAAAQAGFDLNVSADGRPMPVSSLVQRKILFIFREAMANVQRHARATAVALSLVWEVDTLMVRLEDNGIGFEAPQAADPDRFGLVIMSQRAKEIGAELYISTEPGKGTAVILQCPIEVLETNDRPAAGGG